MYRGRRLTRLAVLALALALLVPAAAGAATSKTDKKQNKALVSLGKNIKKATKAINVLKSGVAAQGTSIKGLDTRLKTIETAAPAIIAGLQNLKTALETTIGPGLAKLGAAYPAVEFGVTRVRTGPGGAGPALPFTMTSPDIPDDGNSATAAGEIPIVSGVGTGLIPAGTALSARSAIRSAEADGAATGDPAGYVGGLITMKCGSPTCDVDPGAGTTNVPAGTIVCAVGPPPTQNIDVPGVGPQPFPVVTIQEKTTRTDQTKPDAASPNPIQGATIGAPNGPLANGTEFGCTMGDTGTYLLTVQTQFVDIPTSTTPAPDA